MAPSVPPLVPLVDFGTAREYHQMTDEEQDVYWDARKHQHDY